MLRPSQKSRSRPPICFALMPTTRARPRALSRSTAQARLGISRGAMMADANPASDPFANGSNPFAAIGFADGSKSSASDASSMGLSSAPAQGDTSDSLPMLTVTRGSGSVLPPAAPAPTTGVAPAGASARPVPTGGSSSISSDPFAGGANPFEQIGFEDDQRQQGAAPLSGAGGPLANQPNDGFVSGTLKNIGTTAIRGLAHAPGFVGDIGGFADALTEIPEYVEAKITGQPFADVVAKRDALGAQSTATHDAREKGVLGFSLDPRHYLPSGSQVAAPILAKTGAYQPTTTLGRYGSAVGETVLGALGPGGGGAVKGLADGAVAGVLPGAARIAQSAAQHAPINALAGVSSQAASDASGGDPLASALGGIGATTALGAAHGAVAGRPARKAAAVLAQGTADPQAALEAIRNAPEPIPGVAARRLPRLRTIQASTPCKLRPWGTNARGPQFDARQQQQGRALGSALDALKPGGDPQHVADFFARHFDDIGDRTQAIIDQHLSNAQSQADALRGQGLPVDAYGQQLRGKDHRCRRTLGTTPKPRCGVLSILTES